MLKAANHICKLCGRIFHSKPSSLGYYCSRACARIGRWPALAERFWSKVDRSDPEGCWLWTGGKFRKEDIAYGAFWMGKNNRMAHQVAWELTHGKPFPSGHQGNHKCDIPLCCRPDHIYPGTQADNIRDMQRRGRAVYKPRQGLEMTCPVCEQVFYVAASRANTAKACSRRCAMKAWWQRHPEGHQSKYPG